MRPTIPNISAIPAVRQFRGTLNDCVATGDSVLVDVAVVGEVMLNDVEPQAAARHHAAELGEFAEFANAVAAELRDTFHDACRAHPGGAPADAVGVTTDRIRVLNRLGNHAREAAAAVNRAR